MSKPCHHLVTLIIKSIQIIKDWAYVKGPVFAVCLKGGKCTLNGGVIIFMGDIVFIAAYSIHVKIIRCCR